MYDIGMIMDVPYAVKGDRESEGERGGSQRETSCLHFPHSYTTLFPSQEDDTEYIGRQTGGERASELVKPSCSYRYTYYEHKAQADTHDWN